MTEQSYSLPKLYTLVPTDMLTAAALGSTMNRVKVASRLLILQAVKYLRQEAADVQWYVFPLCRPLQ